MHSQSTSLTQLGQKRMTLDSGLKYPRASLNTIASKELEAHRRELAEQEARANQQGLGRHASQCGIFDDKENVGDWRRTSMATAKTTATVAMGTATGTVTNDLAQMKKDKTQVDQSVDLNSFHRQSIKSSALHNTNNKSLLSNSIHSNDFSHVDGDGFAMPVTRRPTRNTLHWVPSTSTAGLDGMNLKSQNSSSVGAKNAGINSHGLRGSTYVSGSSSNSSRMYSSSLRGGNGQDMGDSDNENNRRNALMRGRSLIHKSSVNPMGALARNSTANRDRSSSRGSSTSRKGNLSGANKPLTLPQLKEQLVQLQAEVKDKQLLIEQLQDHNIELEHEKNAREDEHLQEVKNGQIQMRELQQKAEIMERSAEGSKMEKERLEKQMDGLKSQYYALDQAKQTLQQQVTTLQMNICLKDSTIQSQASELKMLESQLVLIREQYNIQSKQMAHQQDSMEQMEKSLTSCKQELQQAKQTNGSLQLENQSLNNTVENQMKQLSEFDSTRRTLQNVISLNDTQAMQKRGEMMSLKMQYEQLDLTCTEQMKQLVAREERIIRLEQTIAALEARARKDEELRKHLHNTIQELKGNIRVYCRIRPILNGEEKDSNAVFEFPEQTTEQQPVVLVGESSVNYTGQKGESKRYAFNFDRVFRPYDRQEDVFSEISQLVQSALDGFKVCIFAYGQTGSGKTYTMEGPSLNSKDENRGMIPRAVEQIFAHAENLASKGWKYQFLASFLEIYNEKIRDLLAPKDDAYLELTLKKDGKNKNEVEVAELTQCTVQCAQDVYPLLLRASKNRTTGKTDCNDRSSRSHSVFQLFLTGINPITQQQTFGVLNLIDLAGSERLKKSHAQGQQLVETQNINSSLSCLGDVISALSNNHKHIPYRNSKLTHLLMNYFGGQSKTLMFVNLCPETDKTDESLCSLRFAAKVNDCHIGVARRSVMSQSSAQ